MNCGWEYARAADESGPGRVRVCSARRTTPVQSRVTGQVVRRCLNHAQADVLGGQWVYALGEHDAQEGLMPVEKRVTQPGQMGGGASSSYLHGPWCRDHGLSRGEQALQAVTRAWFEALDVLQALVQDACIQTGPDAWDLEVDRESLIQVCAAARTLLYKYRGEV